MPVPFHDDLHIQINSHELEISQNVEDITECAKLNDTSQNLLSNFITADKLYAGHSNSVFTEIESNKIILQGGSNGESEPHSGSIQYTSLSGLIIKSEHADNDSTLIMRGDVVQIGTHNLANTPQIEITKTNEFKLSADTKLMHGNIQRGSFIQLDNAYLTDMSRVLLGEYDDDGAAGGNKIATPTTDGYPDDNNDWFYFDTWRADNALIPSTSDFIVRNESNSILSGNYQDGCKLEVTTAGYYKLEAHVFINHVTDFNQEMAFSFCLDDSNSDKERVGPIADYARAEKSGLLEAGYINFDHVLYLTSGQRVSLLYAKNSHYRVDFSGSNGQADAPDGTGQIRLTFLMP